MSNIFALVKVLLVEQYRPSKNDKKSKRSMIIAYIIIGLCFLPMLVGVFIGILSIGGKLSNSEQTTLLTFLLLVNQGLVLFTGVVSLLNTVYLAKDSNLLLPLPMKSWQLFFAKFLVVYLTETITSAVIVLATVLPLGISAGFGVHYYILMLLCVIIVPMLPLLLSSIIALPFMMISNALKNRGTLKTIITSLFYVTMMGLYFWFITSVSNFPEGDLEQEADILIMIQGLLNSQGQFLKYIYPDYLIAKSMTALAFWDGLLNFVLGLICNVVLLVGAVAISGSFYRKIISKQTENNVSKKKTSKKSDFRNKGVVKELVNVDFKQIMRNSDVGFQIIAGIIMMPIMILFFSISFNNTAVEGGKSLIDTAIEYGMEFIIPLMLFGINILMSSATNIIASTSITRENNNAYMMKVIPVSIERQLSAKIISAMIVMSIEMLVGFIVAVIVFKFNMLYFLALIIVQTTFNLSSAYSGVLTDLMKPSLGWKAFKEGLNISYKSMIRWVLPLPQTIVAIGVSVLCILFYVKTHNMFLIWLMWILLAVVGAVAALIFRNILHSNAQKYLDRLEL